MTNFSTSSDSTPLRQFFKMIKLVFNASKMVTRTKISINCVALTWTLNKTQQNKRYANWYQGNEIHSYIHLMTIYHVLCSDQPKKKKTHHQRRIYKQNMSFWIHSNYHSQLLPKKKTLHVSLPILPIRHMWLIELHFQKNTKCLNCNKNGQTNNVCCNQIFYFLMWRRWNYTWTYQSLRAQTGA